MKSKYYDDSLKLGAQFQLENKSWNGYDVVKYQKQIKDLVVKYNAKTMLDYGCGKGFQYTEPLPYGEEENWKTFDHWLGVEVYKYDPCVEEFKNPPPKSIKFDGVICTQVLPNIPDDDLPWVAKELESYTDKFCFIGVNFQKASKSRKILYDLEYYQSPRTRDFFKGFFKDWKNNNLFWWWKDREYYEGWLDDQLNGTWKDIPETWIGKYEYVEAIWNTNK